MRFAFKVIRESIWNLTGNAIRIPLEIIIVLIFTQNLGIKEYGYSIGAILIVDSLSTFSNLSIDKYIINSKKITTEKLSVAFSLTIISSIIGIIAINYIPIILIYFDKYLTLIPFLNMLSIGYFPSSMKIFFNSYYSRIFANDIITKSVIFSELFSFSIIIFILKTDFSRYTPIIYLVFKNWLSFIFLFINYRNPIKISLNKNSVREIITFGIKFSLNKIILFLNSASSKIYCSLLFGPYFLGLLNIIKKITDIQFLILRPFQNSLIFPLISKLNRDYPEKFSESFIKLKFLHIIFILPIYSFVYAFKDFIISTIFTEQWRNINEFIYLSCLIGFILVLRFSIPLTTIVLGRININIYLSIFRLFLTAIILLTIAPYGLYFILIGELFIELIFLISNYIILNNILNNNLKKKIKPISNAIFSNLILLCNFILSENLISNNLNIQNLSFILIINIIVYIYILNLLERDMIRELVKTIIKYIEFKKDKYFTKT